MNDVKLLLCFPVLVAVAITDYRTHRIWYGFSLYILGIGLGAGILEKKALAEVLAGGMVLFMLLFLLFRLSNGKLLGGGDVKLMAAAGVLLGVTQGLLALLFACIAALLVKLPAYLGKGRKREKCFAFGPYLVLGIFLCLLWGEQLEKLF